MTSSVLGTNERKLFIVIATNISEEVFKGKRRTSIVDGFFKLLRGEQTTDYTDDNYNRMRNLNRN